MFKKIKTNGFFMYVVMLFTTLSCTQKATVVHNYKGWVFVASDTINTNRLHRKIMGRVMDSGDTLFLKIYNENSIAWNIFKADSIFTNIKRDAQSITFKRYDTQFTMKVLHDSKDTLILENNWYKLIFRRSD